MRTLSEELGAGMEQEKSIELTSLDALEISENAGTAILIVER